MDGRLLISAGWYLDKPILKYYNLKTEKIETVYDTTYKNHWLSDDPKGGEAKLLYDSINGKYVTLYKHTRGIPNQDVINYEHKMRKHHNYLLTNQLICGAIYDYNKRLVNMHLDTNQKNTLERMTENSLSPEYTKYLQTYSNILSQPIPNIKRVAIDIEVYTENGVFPSLNDPKHVVTCIGFAGTDGYRHTLQLDDKTLHKREEKGEPFISYIPDEKSLIQIAFGIMDDYPCVVTFNGDDFDLAYLYMRAKYFYGIEDIPIIFNEKDLDGKNLIAKDAVLLKNSIHLDLFRIFKNRSLHNYAFNAKYKQYGLDAISMAMIGESKIKHDKALNELTQEELSRYCLNDAELTLKLTTYSNNLLIKLLILIARITKTSIEDIGRFGISNWIKQMLYFEHRKKKILIPNRDDLKIKGTEASTTAIIKDKKYKGAFVMNPVKGAHFNVVCLDFASLYPSIIKANNISYETINCGHEECKHNIIPETPHYTCTKKIGMLPLLVGVFRDLRVEYFKKLSKDKSLSKEELEVYDAVAQAVKVILNGTYGVLGAEAFQLYCLPVAESVTAQGRYIITETKKYTESLGLQVVYGDTDSLYVVNPSKEQQAKIMKYARDNYNIDLEVDKEYRYVMFSDLKKNYLGVKKDGKLDIKGLVGKKSNIPKFIRDCFNDVCAQLQKVTNKDELEVTKVKISEILKECSIKLENIDFPLEDFVYNHMIQKSLDKYGKKKLVSKNESLFNNNQVVENYKETNVPPHAKVAREMQSKGIKIEDKMFIPFVKSKGGNATWVKQMDKTLIDKEKYKETLAKVFEPLMDVLEMDYKIITQIKNMTLDDIFNQNI